MLGAMASTQAQAEITERRLRPLYDAIDNGQNKKALQIADKIIKKQEDLFCAKALKAIVCQRMGRQEEGNSLIVEVVRACPGDQATLQAATMYYRETGDEQKVVELYSRAAQQYPGNQEILTHLFMAFVRVGNYQKQQQTALSLHKAFPDNGPYYCWRVMSIVMQAHKTNDGSLANSMFLPLAEKLMEKYVLDKKLDIEEEVKLYLMVLDKQDKTEKRLSVLRGNLGSLVRNKDERNNMELECLLSLERWDEAVILLTQMLYRKPDEWSHVEVYISCQIQRYRKSVHEAKEKTKEAAENGSRGGEGERGGEKGEEVWEGKGEGEREEEEGEEEGEEGKGVGEVEGDKSEGATEREEGKDEEGSAEETETQEDSTNRQIPRTPSPKPLTDARDLLEALRDQQCVRDPANRTVTIHALRGPFLGKLELLKQVTQSGLQNVVELATPSILLLDYFVVFGTKSCCFDDLKSYLEFFPKDELKRFMVLAEVKVMETAINFNCPPEEVKRNISIFRWQISLMQLQRYCGYHKNLTLEKKRDLILLCKHMYREGLKLGRRFPDTEPKPGDFFAILGVHILMEIYVESKNWSVLWEAIMLLEYARSMKSNNAQIMLLLMKLYGFIGAAEGITDLFESLNIKHLQMETLGYIPLRYLQSSGVFGFANQLYRSSLRFYYSCAKETSEYIIQAYKNGMFQKILEFVNLRDKLAHSLNFACTLVDMNLLETVTSTHSMDKAHQFFSRDWFDGLPASGPALQEYCSNLIDSRDLTIYEDWSRSASSREVTSLTKLENRLSSELEILWLRVRVMLIQCLKESVVRVAGMTPPSCPQVGGAKGGASEGVVVFSERVVELSKSLALMTQHMGMLVLQQKKSHLLPIQTSPPCLGLRFLGGSHGHTMLVMLGAVERLALGEASVEDKLKEVVKTLRGNVSMVQGIPDSLREAMTEVVKGGTRERGGEDGERGGRKEGKGWGERSGEEGDGERGGEEGDGEKGGEVGDGEKGGEVGDGEKGGEEGDGEKGGEVGDGEKGGEGEGEVKENDVDSREGTEPQSKTAIDPLNLIPTVKVDLEHYVLFISVVSYVVLLSGVCVEIIMPAGNQSRRKKKKRSDETRHKDHSAIKEFVSFMEELCSLLREVSRPFRPFPSVGRQLLNLEEEIRHCQPPFEDRNYEWSVYPQACKLILQSYNMSMEDCQEVLDAKLKFLGSLISRLSGRKLN